MIKKRAVEVWRVYQNLSAQHRVHALSCLLLHVGQHVGVGVLVCLMLACPSISWDHAG
jgi:hypothetical protein